MDHNPEGKMDIFGEGIGDAANVGDGPENNSFGEATKSTNPPTPAQQHDSPRDSARETLRIALSCDPEDAEVLIRFKVGRYTVKSAHDKIRPTKLVRIPKFQGQAETTQEIWRCARPNCTHCAATKLAIPHLPTMVPEQDNLSGDQVEGAGIEAAIMRNQQMPFTPASHDAQPPFQTSSANIALPFSQYNYGAREPVATPVPSPAYNAGGSWGSFAYPPPNINYHDHRTQQAPPSHSSFGLLTIARQALLRSGNHAVSSFLDNAPPGIMNQDQGGGIAAPTLTQPMAGIHASRHSEAPQGVDWTRDAIDARIRSPLEQRKELDAEIYGLHQLRAKTL